MFLWYVLWYYIVPPTNARTERETYRNCITQPRISFIVYQCPIYLLQIKGRENLSLSVNFGNIHQLTGPWTSLLWVEPLLSTQKHTTCNWVKKCKKWPASILDVPAPIVRASPPDISLLWHHFRRPEAGTKDYKRSCTETNKQIPNRYTLSFIGRTASPARLGSPGSAPPTGPPSSPSPTWAASFPSHAQYVCYTTVILIWLKQSHSHPCALVSPVCESKPPGVSRLRNDTKNKEKTSKK